MSVIKNDANTVIPNSVQTKVLAGFNSLGLTGFSRIYQDHLSDPQVLGPFFNERLLEMIGAQETDIFDNRVATKLKSAHLRNPNATLGEIEYLPDRGLDKALIETLAEGGFIARNEHIVLLGASGAGKTYIACAIGSELCRHDIAARYVLMPDLLKELEKSRLEGTTQRTREKYKKIPVLIIDEFLFSELSPAQAKDFYDIADDRSVKGSLILCSQFDPKTWYMRLGETTPATVRESILDRLVYRSHMILIQGEVSMRKRHGLSVE